MFYQWHLQNQGGTIDEEIIAQLPENSAYLIASEESGFQGSFGNLLEEHFGNTGAITTVSFLNDPTPSNKISSALIVSHPKSKNKAYAYISDTGNELIVAPEKSEIEIYANNLCIGMFSGYSDSLFANVTSFNFTNFNVSKVSDMCRMFYYCGVLSTISGLSNWDTSNVTDMSSMFYNCEALTS